MSEIYTPIEKLEVTTLFASISDEIWAEVATWKPFAQNSIGSQLVRAIDSVAANIVEGGHRQTNPDAIHFFCIARASGEEAVHHLERARVRQLVSDQFAEEKMASMRKGLRLLTRLISFRRGQAKVLREHVHAYGDAG